MCGGLASCSARQCIVLHQRPLRLSVVGLSVPVLIFHAPHYKCDRTRGPSAILSSLVVQLNNCTGSVGELVYRSYTGWYTRLAIKLRWWVNLT